MAPVRRGGGVSVAGAAAGEMIYPLVRELAGDRVPVTVTCQVLDLAREPYTGGLAAPIDPDASLPNDRGVWLPGLWGCWRSQGDP